MNNHLNEIYVDSSDNPDDNFLPNPDVPPPIIQPRNINYRPNPPLLPIQPYAPLVPVPNQNNWNRLRNHAFHFPPNLGGANNNRNIHMHVVGPILNINRPHPIIDNPDAEIQQPPELKLKTKVIHLININITIVDVPAQVLTYVQKACNASLSSFSLPCASSYVDSVFRQNEKINDNFYERMLLAGTEQMMDTQVTLFKEQSEAICKFYLAPYKLDEIKRVLKQNNYCIEKVLHEFEQNGQLYSRIKTPRSAPKTLNITDCIVSVQLDDLYKQQEEKRKKKEKEDMENLQYETAQAEGSLIECECCCCEYPFEWMIQCHDGHLMCKKCVEKQIETAISEGRSNVPCLHFGGCDKMIPISELERLIPEKTLERLFATETLNAITVANLANKVKCYKCGFIVLFDGDGPMICPQCKAQTCPKCGEAWHPNMTCEEFKAIDKDRLIEEQMNEAVVRTCPVCKTQFMKDEGCNKMECPRCHTWICYLCRQVIPKTVGYNHFWRGQGPCPPDKCPLWVKNEALHIVEAAKAKDDAKDNLAG